jgi:hypothetical protein
MKKRIYKERTTEKLTVRRAILEWSWLKKYRNLKKLPLKKLKEPLQLVEREYDLVILAYQI